MAGKKTAVGPIEIMKPQRDMGASLSDQCVFFNFPGN